MFPGSSRNSQPEHGLARKVAVEGEDGPEKVLEFLCEFVEDPSDVRLLHLPTFRDSPMGPEVALAIFKHLADAISWHGFTGDPINPSAFLSPPKIFARFGWITYRRRAFTL